MFNHFCCPKVAEKFLLHDYSHHSCDSSAFISGSGRWYGNEGAENSSPMERLTSYCRKRGHVNSTRSDANLAQSADLELHTRLFAALSTEEIEALSSLAASQSIEFLADHFNLAFL